MSEDCEIRFLVPSRSDSTRQREGGSVRVEAGARSAAAEASLVRLAARPGRDVVRLELVNGPELILHPESARELFLAQRLGPNRSASTTDGLLVPTRLEWRGSESMAGARGALAERAGQVVLHAFEVIKDAVVSQGANLAVTKIEEWVDGLVTPGLHPLTTKTPKLDGVPVMLTDVTRGPILILVHGTFSSTAGSFKRLWDDNPELVEQLLRHFDGRVYGFEHPTLGVSPLENAVELAKVLPAGVPVHFLTHSRGGLVVEALAQLASRALTADDTLPFSREEYPGQRAALQQLSQLARGRIHVERVVRVACPARGTLLASNRLDAYLSVLKWGLELAQVPVAPEVADFLLEVAKRRTKSDELPGLEAMMPESPFIQWLHSSEEEVPGELRVVAGDLQGDSILSWVKTLLADAFYWPDNDLIVQTRSMYGGSPRRGGSRFFLDRGGKVSHFNYFSNSGTAQAIARALDPTIPLPEGFEPIGPQSSTGLSSSGHRGGVISAVAASRSPAKPAVILLPGILGSHLKLGNTRVWLSPLIFNGLQRLQYGVRDVTPDQPLGLFYDALAEHLAESHEVIPFPFDWRKPIEEEALRLAGVVREALDERKTSGQPVRLIAHSMGGLVARALQFVASGVWDEFMQHPDARLLMLGTPNGGSWAPMQVLSGDNLLGSLVSYVGALFDDVKARAIFAGLPGFLQLQAGMLDSSTQLWDPESWRKLANHDRLVLELDLPWHSLALQKRAADWGIPAEPILRQARELHERLARQDLSAYGARVLMVVGQARHTPSGFETGSERGFDYLQSDRGDGTVTLANALLPGVRAWRVDVEHSQLPIPGELHPGYAELLSTGSTTLGAFSPVESKRGGAPAAGADVSERMPRIARLRGWTDEALAAVEGTLTLPSDGGRSTSTPSAAGPALRVCVVNGDLTFVREPLLLGHYRSMTLTGAERVMDRFLGGTMSEALHLRRYPTATEESEVFSNLRPNPANPQALPRPAAVVVVGLGPEGELRAEHLSKSVRQGVIGYAQRLAESPKTASSFELAAALVGSGGVGVSVATSARAVIQGVRAANERLLKEGWPIVAKLSLVELYEDRAVEALRELVAAAERYPAAFEVERQIRLGHGPLPRPETPGYRGAEYDIVSALDGPRGEDGQATIAFTIDTRRARTEVRSSTTQLDLLRSLISDAQADRHSDTNLGKTLFRVLVPQELDSVFGDSEAVMLEVDQSTAPIPWELLNVDHDDDDPNDRPWAIRCKLVRKLKSTKFREGPNPAGPQAGVLVCGDPDCDRQIYPVLEGARREARAVAKVLGVERPLQQANARVMVNALLERPYSIVHIAGHGNEEGNVVMTGKQVLGADLVAAMRRVPDLVFVNCCYSGSGLAGAEGAGVSPRDRPKRAATVARALIEIGVRCVIAAGWAVDDEAAERFAGVFYERLLGGARFIDATSAAREAAWSAFRSSNTWAAYQCYGDPDWTLASPDNLVPPTAKRQAREPLIASASALLVALKAIAAARTDGAEPQVRLQELDRIHGPRFGHLGVVAEGFGVAYSDLGDRARAIEWYRRAVDAEQGDASFRVLEQLCNLIIRRAAERVDEAYWQWESDKKSDHFHQVVSTARREIEAADADLVRLTEFCATYERVNLRASAWKRRTMILQAVERVAPSGAAAEATQQALQCTVDGFAAAEKLARRDKRSDIYYSQLNRMTADLVLHLAEPSYAADETGAKEVEACLKARNCIDADFWSVVQIEELEIYRALCARRLAAALPEIEQGLRALKERIASPRQWSTVRDQARFTLRPYTALARDDERVAAVALSAVLEKLAQGGT